MYLDTFAVAPVVAKLHRISRTIRTPVMRKILDFVNPRTDEEAANVVVSVVRYITREKTFRETICTFVESIELRSEAKRLIVCDFDVIVRLKLAIMECMQNRVGDFIETRDIFEKYGLHRDDAYVYFTISLARFRGFPTTRRKIIGVTLPTPEEVTDKAHSFMFADDSTVRRSIRSLIRKKLTFISNNYSISIPDLEMDVLTASLEGFYLSLPFMASDQHIKASAVSTAKNKINKMISYYQTLKRRQISRDDATGNFINSMVSMSQQNNEGVEVGDNIIFHNFGAEDDVHDLFEMRTSLARINVRERCQTRRKALNLILGQNYDRFKRTQEKKHNQRFRSYEDVIDELGVKKYLDEVRAYVGMSRTEMKLLLHDVRAVA